VLQEIVSSPVITFLIAFIAVAIIIIGLTLIAGKSGLKLGKARFRFAGLELYFDQEIQEIRDRLSVPSPPALDTTAEGREAVQLDRQYALLKEYYAQGLAQSKISFWFSLIFASLGFGVIITALLTIDRGASITQQGQSIAALVAGTIIDSVSALFFVQSNRARQLMTEFFDKLRIDRKLDESLNLVGAISDKELQGRMQALLALNFVEVDELREVVREIVKSAD
jgi:hypothetical protein